MPGLLNQIFRSIHESNLGRIRWRSNMWAVVNSRWDRNRLSSIAGELFRTDWLGQPMVLVKRRCVHVCPNPPGTTEQILGKELRLSEFVATAIGSKEKGTERPAWWVPATECRKCSYHRAAGRNGIRFPRCTFDKGTTKDVAIKTLVEVGDMVTKAREQAEEIVKGNV